MTADRWWVRLAARWLARVEAVAPMVRMGMLSMTGLSTALIGLKQYGYDEYARPLIAVVVVGTLVFTWYYTEGGVFNQKNRDWTDMGDNYSGPTMLMDARLEAKQLAYLAYVLQTGTDKSFDEIQADMQELTDTEWAAMRDGIDVTRVGGQQ